MGGGDLGSLLDTQGVAGPFLSFTAGAQRQKSETTTRVRLLHPPTAMDARQAIPVTPPLRRAAVAAAVFTAIGCGSAPAGDDQPHEVDARAAPTGDAAPAWDAAYDGAAEPDAADPVDPGLVIYPSPGDLSSVEHLVESTDYAVTVNGSSVFVYETDNYWVNSGRRPEDKAAFAMFSFAQGTVTVRVTASFPITSVTIRPIGDAVTFTQDADTISFQLSEPKKLSIEINDRQRPLFLFADRPDPNPETDAAHYFGPGVHHIGTKYPVSAGEHVYLAGGAVVEGTLLVDGNDFQIRGRGILTAGDLTWEEWTADKKLSLIAQTTWSPHGHTYEGVTLLNSPGWFINGGGANRTFTNIRVIAWVGNSDAPHLHQDGLMEDVFIFNNDDQLIINTGSNAVFRNCVVWKGRWGRSIISLKSSALMENIVWEDIDIIGSSNVASPLIKLLSFQVADGHMSDYAIRNVRIEGPRESPLIHVDANDFDIENLVLENVTAPSQLASEGHLNVANGYSIDGVHFHGLALGGEVMTSLEETHITAQGTVTDVTFDGAP